ncbi:MAG: hypothetical protein QG670_2653 [Thermoproteota archaeon]|nr:hypothetical protein [Thermoproteota archaeon]
MVNSIGDSRRKSSYDRHLFRERRMDAFCCIYNFLFINDSDNAALQFCFMASWLSTNWNVSSSFRCVFGSYLVCKVAMAWRGDPRDDYLHHDEYLAFSCMYKEY